MNSHILLIEDDADVAVGLQDGLTRDGLRVTWCNTGHSGVQRALELKPHLIILDVRLPDGSGFDFCRQLRQNGVNQPLLMLTVQRDEADKILGLEMGADDYVTKPFSLRELLSRVRALLRRTYGEFAAVSDSEITRVGDLLIDRQRGQVRRGETPLTLTPIELRLLLYLLRYQSQALTRAQILDGVWGYPHDHDGEKLVNVHIRRLREKIETDPSAPTLILTVPGVGYRMAQVSR
jgi:DNA-binding response OmpR family regulator